MFLRSDHTPALWNKDIEELALCIFAMFSPTQTCASRQGTSSLLLRTGASAWSRWYLPPSLQTKKKGGVGRKGGRKEENANFFSHRKRIRVCLILPENESLYISRGGFLRNAMPLVIHGAGCIPTGKCASCCNKSWLSSRCWSRCATYFLYFLEETRWEGEKKNLELWYQLCRGSANDQKEKKRQEWFHAKKFWEIISLKEKMSGIAVLILKRNQKSSCKRCRDVSFRKGAVLLLLFFLGGEGRSWSRNLYHFGSKNFKKIHKEVEGRGGFCGYAIPTHSLSQRE